MPKDIKNCPQITKKIIQFSVVNYANTFIYDWWEQKKDQKDIYQHLISDNCLQL